uniref:biotin/lipoyl-containing protein n=1 Tax=Legionella tunisiensis TaxID=1034944 RepID=UPI000301A787
MPGNIVSVNVTVGDKVTKGQTLLVLEAMKMETEIQAPFNGTVADVFCQKGDKVMPTQVLVYLLPNSD